MNVNVNWKSFEISLNLFVYPLLKSDIMSILEHLNIPTLLLGSLLGLTVWILYSASRSKRFEPVDMLLDERGKASSSRLAVFVALAVSTFMLVYLTTNKGVDDETLLYMFGAYIMTWAGSKTLEKGVEAWSSKGSRPRRDYSDYHEEEDWSGYSPPPRRRRVSSSLGVDEPDLEYPERLPLPHARFSPQSTPLKEDLSDPKEMDR